VVDAGGPYFARPTEAVTLTGLLGGDTFTVASVTWHVPGCTVGTPGQRATLVTCRYPGGYTARFTATRGDGTTVSDTAPLTAAFDPFTCPGAAPHPFGDVAGSFAARQIGCAFARGIAVGIGPGIFGPGSPVSREQMAVFLMAAYEAATGRPYGGAVRSSFVDVTGSFAQARIAQLIGLGITAGTGPGTYGPEQVVTRAEMAVFLLRLLEALAGQAPLVPANNPFTDIRGSFAEREIRQLVALGLTSGTGATTFGPADPVTREQMAAFTVALLDAAT